MVVGSVAMALAAVQWLVGAFFRPNNGKKLRHVFDIVHHRNGLVIVALATANLFIGLNQSKPLGRYYWAQGIVLAVLGALYVLVRGEDKTLLEPVPKGETEVKDQGFTTGKRVPTGITARKTGSHVHPDDSVSTARAGQGLPTNGQSLS
jgi:hypothetical protein